MKITCQEVCPKLIILEFCNNSTWNQFLEALCMQQSLHSTTEPCIKLHYEVWVLATIKDTYKSAAAALSLGLRFNTC